MKVYQLTDRDIENLIDRVRSREILLCDGNTKEQNKEQARGQFVATVNSWIESVTR